jgi:hypothetical protein
MSITRQEAKKRILEHLHTLCYNRDIISLLGLDDGTELSADEEDASSDARDEVLALLEKPVPDRWPAALDHSDAAETPEEAWGFWKDIVCNPDGTINVEQVKLELSDFSMLMRFYGAVLCAVTGHRISKVNTHPSNVVSVFEDYLSERIEEEVTEDRKYRSQVIEICGNGGAGGAAHLFKPTPPPSRLVREDEAPRRVRCTCPPEFGGPGQFHPGRPCQPHGSPR